MKDSGHILIVLSRAVKIGQTEKVGKANSAVLTMTVDCDEDVMRM